MRGSHYQLIEQDFFSRKHTYVGPSFLPRVPISPSHTNTARTLCGVTNAICVRAIIMICWFNVRLYWPCVANSILCEQIYICKHNARGIRANIDWFKKA